MALAVLPALLVADSAGAQMLSRDFRELWKNEVFENYGASSYRDYDFDEENRRFDFFGDLIVDGVDVVRINEIRRNTPGKLGSFETRNARYDRFFDKLIIANEGFGPWSTRLIVGDHITSRFTPMTLNLPQFNGIRWDGSSKKNRFSVLAAQLNNRVFVPPGAPLDNFFDQRRIFGSSLLGAHWESQVGDLLKLGTTFVNAHRFDGEGSAKANSLKGTIPQAMQGGLRKVFVFFSDDEPTDSNPGALIHDLTMFANGEVVAPTRVGRIDNLIARVPVTPDRTSTIVLRQNEITYLRKHRSWVRPVIDASNTPFFINLIDEITEPSAIATRRAPLRADDTDIVFYEYVMPDSVDEIRFVGVIANDYSVDVVGAVQVRTIAVGDDDLFYDWQNVLRADGKPRNSSNLRQVEFTYGFPTGLSILGFNFESNVLGFHFKGEFARSQRYLRVPSTRGKRSERSASMFYFNAQRPLHDRADVGFELFDVPEDYTTEFSVFKSTGFGNTAFTTGGRLYREVNLVDDNDDLDQWSDGTEHNDPLAPFATSLRADGNGVFPGFDPDGDGVLDFNVDGGGGNDAFQPFIGYYSEPLELVYGDDFNNNGIADERENDNLPDYLYQRDHRGVHGFVQVRPTEFTKIKAGAYSIDQEALGTANDTRYLEGQLRRDWEGGYVRFNQRFKWIEDDIANTIYATNSRPGATFARTLDLLPDLLENRDSFNSLTYAEWGLRTISNVNVSTIFSFEFTDLDGEIPKDTQLRKPGDITALAVVNKIDYTWRSPLRTVDRVPGWLEPILARVVVRPQFKHIYQRDKVPEREIPDRQRRWIMPILRMDYQLGPRTILKTGIQGLPLLTETSKDSANPSQDFRRSTYTAFIHNRSNYSGYDLNILMGVFRTKQTFTGNSRPSLGFVEYFFKIFIG